MSVRIYVEGGGDTRGQQAPLRRAFSELLSKSGFQGRLPSVICAGSRNEAFKDFCRQLAIDGNDVLLLVDAEGPVHSPAWEYLNQRDNWTRPAGASDDQAQLMVQLMESWFLCDHGLLAAYFREGFAKQRLPGTETNLEPIAKSDVESGLKAATRPSRRGEYNKASHSADLLRQLPSNRLRTAAPHFEQLLAAIEARS